MSAGAGDPGKGSSKGGKERPVAKAAAIVAATGLAWTFYKSVKARKEEDALIEAYYGDRPDFVVPEPEEQPPEEWRIHEELDAHPKALAEEHRVISGISHLSQPGFSLDVRHAVDEVQSIASKEDAARSSDAHPDTAEVDDKPWFFFGLGKKTESNWKSKKPQSYHIQKGDTLWGISGKYGISLDALKAANGLSGDEIYAGDMLVIPGK